MAGGFRSLGAFWIGGAAQPPAGPAPVNPGGVRSMLAFWMGGAYGYSATAGAATPLAGTDEPIYTDYRRIRHAREDREILAAIRAFLDIV